MSVVGERAVALCHRGSGVYDVYCAQWAGTDCILRTVFESGLEAAISALSTARWDHESICSKPAAVNRLDYLNTEALFVLEDSSIATYQPIWLGIPTGETDTCPSGNGLCWRIRSLAEYRSLRRNLSRVKTVLGIAVESEQLSPEEATGALLGILNRWWY